MELISNHLRFVVGALFDSGILKSRITALVFMSLGSIMCRAGDLDAELQNRALATKAKNEFVTFLADVAELCILDDQFSSISNQMLDSLIQEVEKLPYIKAGEISESQVFDLYGKKVNTKEHINNLLKQRIFSERPLPDNLFTFKELKAPLGLSRIKQLHARVRAEREVNRTFDSIYNLVSVNLIASLIANGQQSEANGVWQQLDQNKYNIEWIQSFSLTLITELPDPKKINISIIESFLSKFPGSFIGYRAKLLYLAKNNGSEFEGKNYKETIKKAISLGSFETKRIDGLFKLLCHICDTKDRPLITEVFQLIQTRNPDISEASRNHRIELVEIFDARKGDFRAKINGAGREASIVKMLMEL
jgi:hypothetical protein